MPAIEIAATPRTPGRTSAHGGEVLTSRLGGQEYVIDILRVQEIRSYESPTRIANAPEFVRGVVGLRGVIVPVVDLRLKFGREHRILLRRPVVSQRPSWESDLLSSSGGGAGIGMPGVALGLPLISRTSSGGTSASNS